MAVAGFSPAELDVTVQENTLLVTGKAQKEDENGSGYLHRGIARRSFERRFSLADHMKVTGAGLDNGLLHVDVVREVPGQPSCVRSKSAPRSRPCSRSDGAKRRPNQSARRTQPSERRNAPEMRGVSVFSSLKGKRGSPTMIGGMGGYEFLLF
jgi:hypothetical protein